MALGVFQQVLIRISPQDGSPLLQWYLSPEYRPRTNTLSFYVERSSPSMAEWERLNPSSPVINQNLYTAPVSALYGIGYSAWYRVVMVDGSETSSSAATSISGNLSLYEYRLAKTVLKNEHYRLTKLCAGHSFHLLKIRTTGPACTQCLDFDLGTVVQPNCPICYGTGYTYGYYNGFPFLAETAIGEEKEEIQFLQMKAVAYPDFDEDDLIVDAVTNLRYAVDTRKVSAELRGVPLLYALLLRELPRNDIAYSVPLKVESAISTPESWDLAVSVIDSSSSSSTSSSSSSRSSSSSESSNSSSSLSSRSSSSSESSNSSSSLSADSSSSSSSRSSRSSSSRSSSSRSSSSRSSSSRSSSSRSSSSRSSSSRSSSSRSSSSRSSRSSSSSSSLSSSSRSSSSRSSSSRSSSSRSSRSSSSRSSSSRSSLSSSSRSSSSISSSGSASALDPDASAYLASVEAADGEPLEAGVRSIINDFVVGLKTDGAWDSISGACILAGARTLTGALVPLKGPSPTNSNFVNGDYARKTGLIGNGLTKRLDSNILANTLQQDNHSLGAYVTSPCTASDNSRGFIGVWMDNVLAVARDAWSSPGGLLFYSANSTAQWFPDVGGSTGLIALSRSASTEVITRYGQTNRTRASTSAGPFSAANIMVFRLFENTNARLSFYWAGDSLDLAKLDTRMQTLMTALGSAI